MRKWLIYKEWCLAIYYGLYLPYGTFSQIVNLSLMCFLKRSHISWSMTRKYHNTFDTRSGYASVDFKVDLHPKWKVSNEGAKVEKWKLSKLKWKLSNLKWSEPKGIIHSYLWLLFLLTPLVSYVLYELF